MPLAPLLLLALRCTATAPAQAAGVASVPPVASAPAVDSLAGALEGVERALRAGAPEAARAALEPLLEPLLAAPPAQAPALLAAARLADELGVLEPALRLRRAYVARLEAARPPDDVELLVERVNVVAQLLQLGLDGPEVADLPAALERLAARLDPKEESLLFARSVCVHACLAAGELERAREEAEELVRLREALAREPTRTREARRNLALILERLGEREAALELERRDVAELEAQPESDPLALARARANLAASLGHRGEHEAARRSVEAALEGYARVYPADHPEPALARVTLGWLLLQLGELESALAAAERALDELRRSVPAGDPRVGMALVTLGDVVCELGDLPRARALQQEAVRLHEQAGERTLDLPRARFALASTLELLGDHGAARAQRERGLAVFEQVLPEDDLELCSARELHALSLLEAGLASEALAVERGVLALRSQALPPGHPHVIAARIDLALMLRALGRAEEARAEDERVLALLLADPEAAPADVALVRQNLAVDLLALGERERASELLEQAWEVARAQLPPAHPERQGLALVRARLRVELGRAPFEAEELDELLAGLREGARELWLAPRREASERAATAVELLGQLDDLLAARPAPERRDGALFALLEELRAPALGALPAGAPGERAEELRTALAEAARSLQEALDGSAPAEELARRVELRDRAEAELRGERVRAGEQAAEAAAALDPARLAAALEPDVRVVCFARLSGADELAPDAREERMVAWLLAPNGSLTRFDLGDARALGEAVAEWREALGVPGGVARGRSPFARAGAPDAERAAAERVRLLALEPLLAAAGSARRWIVCLDDALAAAPLEALPLGDGTLLGERLALQRESALTLAFGRRAARVEPARVLALGGVEYGAPAEPRGTRAGALLAPLPGTRREVHSIASAARAAGAEQVVLLEGREATVEAFRARAPRASVLHVATHGWYAAEEETSAAPGDAAPGDAARGDAAPGDMAPGASAARASREELVTSLAPAAACGLALAGAGAGRDALGRRQGVLTAEELASLDLSRCRLAVLSACESGLGRARSGQGLLSLQAALHAAGARSAITSLWQVDDDATRAFFERFYAGLWAEGLSSEDALRAAQRALREEGRPTRDWAGWVLSGDPR